MMTTALAATIGLAGSAIYFSPWLWRQYRMSRIRKEIVRDRTIALTYDDGPSSAFTPRLLDLLQSRGARATFFMLGRHALLNPQIVDRVIQEGHDIGCHSDQHMNAWKVLPWEAVTDINRGYKQLSRWIGSNGMFRPPHGKMTLPTYWSIRQRRSPVWWWTVDSGDTHAALPTASQVVDRLQQDGGGIVLMHDLARTQSRDEFVLETTSAILDFAERESFQIKRLSELCK